MESNQYFRHLNQLLKKHERAIPCLVIDQHKLNRNISTLKNNWSSNIKLRIVVKSLPCVELIQHVMRETNSKDLMVFHQPFLTDLASRLDNKADILLGKPMPIKTVEYFYNHLPGKHINFDAFQQIQWLVDTDDRIKQYINLAKILKKVIRINLEIDVGLHRGGYSSIDQLRKGLQLIIDNKEFVRFSGLMGYDAHVVKLPKAIRSVKKASQLSNQFYQDCKDLIRKEFPSLYSDNLTFNGGGSPTVNIHKKNNSPINDLSIGSCLVKPTTFDIPSLSEYEPACYISTPVLKAMDGTTLPAMEGMKNTLNFVSAKNRKSYFIYGGFWKADYCYPQGINQNKIFGSSTNQTMINGSVENALNPDDFVFLRPHQSEFVFLQFGEILCIKNDTIKKWTLLNNC